MTVPKPRKCKNCGRELDANDIEYGLPDLCLDCEERVPFT